jgi:adenine-specific DNA-methyltransferase
LSAECRNLYAETIEHRDSSRLEKLARIGIGYVTGDNKFFHLRPSEAAEWKIPAAFLRPSVRKGEVLRSARLTQSAVENWHKRDDEMLLLHIAKESEVPRTVQRYLDSEPGQIARTAFKCRTRSPWYSVPDVQTPDCFLSYMSGVQPVLVRNDARCTCTNSVHAVRLQNPREGSRVQAAWNSNFVQLSCEIEGHPLGGGMLKLEPGEASQIVIPGASALKRLPSRVIAEGVNTMRAWRHYGEG